MPLKLDTSSPDFEEDFARLLRSKREVAEDVNAAVAEIIASVRNEGDEALLRLTQKYDNLKASKVADLRISQDDIAKAAEAISNEQREALKVAAERIKDFHQKQIPQDITHKDASGMELKLRHLPIASAGLYVPGGKAAYPSSVLMGAVPAEVAGVKRRVMVAPCPDGKVSEIVLAAAHLANITEIWKIGGAQAIAALAYGTETIASVDKIIGPGNAYVAAAKSQVFGQVGIDSIAGPSEILVLADKTCNPDWVAIDLLSQAEHDEAAQAILITDEPATAEAVIASINETLPSLERKAIASASWQQHGVVITVKDWSEGAALANRIAAEHVEIVTESPEILAEKIENAGALFLGSYTPEALGDYIAGSNHILPTARSARFASGLGVKDFIKATSILNSNEATLKTIGGYAMTLAEAEGLEAHKRSLEKRLKR